MVTFIKSLRQTPERLPETVKPPVFKEKSGAIAKLKVLHAEAEETAIIFGMPHELIERGGADVVLPCQSVASQLISWASFRA